MSELAALLGREVGRITIGAMPLSRAKLLPAAVTAFHAAHPGVGIGIIEGSHADLVGPLRDGDLDMMVGALRAPNALEGLTQTPLFRDRPVVLARSGHPLTGACGGFGPAAMLSFHWITSAPETPLRTQWEAMFEAAGSMAPAVAIECGSVMMIRQMLVQSDALTLLSPDQVAVELEAGWLVKVADAPAEIARTIGVSTRSDWRPTVLQQAFLDTLTEQAEAMSL
jgi:DNA-binding transcriptional LysR family regulator